MNKWCHLNLLGDLTNVPNLSAWLSQAATECKELDLPKAFVLPPKLWKRVEG